MTSLFNHTAALEKKVVDSSDDRGRRLSIDEETKNYPSEGDSTASGGYGSTQNVWSDTVQRGNIVVSLNTQDTYAYGVPPSPWNSYPATPRAETPVHTEQVVPEKSQSVLSKEVREAQDGKADDISRIVGA